MLEELCAVFCSG